MKVEVLFGLNNITTVRARNNNDLRIVDMCGPTEELTEEIKDTIARLEDELEALKVALARILYSPSFL